MPKLTNTQMTNGRNRFLASHADIRSRIERVTEAHAVTLGVTLEQLRESETMRELRDVAVAKGVDQVELFWSYVADTPDELADMIKHRDHAIKKALDL